MPRALKLDKAGKLKLSEADVVRQVEDFLQLHGWRVFATGYGEIVRGERVVATVGEEFMPDRLCVRYGAGAYAELIWLELKRPKCAGDSGGRLSKGQKFWLQVETLRGATCLVVSDFMGFRDWYRKVIGVR